MAPGTQESEGRWAVNKRLLHDHMITTRIVSRPRRYILPPSDLLFSRGMPIFKNIDAWIEVNSQRLTEYDVAVDDHAGGVPSVSCWIPSTAEQVRECKRGFVFKLMVVKDVFYPLVRLQSPQGCHQCCLLR
jgi:hypothetical protein